MTSPCKSIVNEAKKKLSLFSKDEWSAALLFIKAAECFLSEGNKKEALKNALKAADILKKIAKKSDVGVVLPDIEKALKVAYSAAEEERIRRKISEDLFGTIMLRAQMAITSGDYSAAALYYKRAIEYAPTGEQAKEAIQRAITNLSQLAEKKLSLGMTSQASKIMNIVEDFKVLLEAAEEEVKLELPKKKLKVVLKSEDTFENAKDAIMSFITSKGFPQVTSKDEANYVVIEAMGKDVNLSFKISKDGGNIIMEASSHSDSDLFEMSEAAKEEITDKLLRAKVIEQELEGEVTKKTVFELLNKTKDEVLIGSSYNIVLKNLELALNVMKEKKFGDSKPLEEIIKRYSKYLESSLKLEEVDEFMNVLRTVLSKLGG